MVPAKQPAQNLTPQQIQVAKQKIQQVSTKAANSIFQELMKEVGLGEYSNPIGRITKKDIAVVTVV